VSGATRFLLLRHADHDLVGRALAGRMPGVGLNVHGRGQAARLADRLAGLRIAAVFSSPQQRAQETAAPIAAACGRQVELAPGFDEVDFGAWTGLSFDVLAREQPEAWAGWCMRRGSATPPGGEPFAQVQLRALAELERLRKEHAGATIAVVSHADVLRAVVAGVLGSSLDLLERFEIAPASLSVVEAGEGWQRLLLLNDRG
jgi:probable phosphoglycerate mutase